MGALFHRERTGEATVVDVSLLGSGMWAMGQSIGLAIATGQAGMMPSAGAMTRRNPLVANYKTKDGKWLALCCLQAGHYWPPMCEAIGRPELVTDPRFADHASLLEHGGEAIAILTEVFAERTVAEWREALDDFVGQWTVVQDALEVAADRQSVANEYVQPQLVTAPVQFGDEPNPPGRAPEFNEHGEEILTELAGLDWDTIIDLKVRGVVA
jgi:crotonobetainyl-CoA:carnitine CoA-transferase CaiB-like acyl-CoA transferase